jgi:hypothetical protein
MQRAEWLWKVAVNIGKMELTVSSFDRPTNGNAPMNLLSERCRRACKIQVDATIKFNRIIVRAIGIKSRRTGQNNIKWKAFSLCLSPQSHKPNHSTIVSVQQCTSN